MASNRQLAPRDASAMPANNQLVPCTQNTQSRIRTNIVVPKPLRFYIPDDDDSVPYAFMLGRHAISTAGGCEQALLSGYFSALCAVLPDLTSIAKKVVQNLGYKVEEIAIPSQAARVNIEVPHQSHDLKLEILMLAQMCYLPFVNNFDATLDRFWCQLASNVKVRLSSYLMCSVNDMKTINFALMMSGLEGELCSSIGSARRALAATSTPFGLILSEAARLRQTSGVYSCLFS